MRTALPHARHRTRRVVATLAGLGAVLALASPAGAAGAAEAADVAELPGYITPLQQLTLLGAGPAGYTVARDHTQVFTARAGAPFADNGIEYSEGEQPEQRVQQLKDVTGNQLRWVAQTGEGSSIHAADLRTGSTSVSAVSDQPLAFTPTGYVGWAGDRITLHREGLADKTLVDGVVTTAGLGGGSPVADADANGALIGYALPAPGEPWPARTLVYVPFGAGETEVVVAPTTPPGYSPTQLELTPSSFVWLAQGYSTPGFMQVWRKPRSGGAATSFTPTTDPRSVALDFAATDQQIALAESHVNRGSFFGATSLNVLVGSDWRSVPLPETVDGTVASQPQQFGGVEAIGNKLVYALGSAPLQAAGVHEITPAGGSTRIATLTENYQALEDVALAEGRLYYANTTGGDTSEAALRLIARRAISRDSAGNITLGVQETGQVPFRHRPGCFRGLSGRSPRRSLLRVIAGCYAACRPSRTTTWPATLSPRPTWGRSRKALRCCACRDDTRWPETGSSGTPAARRCSNSVRE